MERTGNTLYHPLVVRWTFFLAGDVVSSSPSAYIWSPSQNANRGHVRLHMFFMCVFSENMTWHGRKHDDDPENHLFADLPSDLIFGFTSRGYLNPDTRHGRILYNAPKMKQLFLQCRIWLPYSHHQYQFWYLLARSRWSPRAAYHPLWPVRLWVIYILLAVDCRWQLFCCIQVIACTFSSVYGSLVTNDGVTVSL